jgi:hypothetical protein
MSVNVHVRTHAYIYIHLYKARYNLWIGINEAKKQQPPAGQAMQEHCSSQQEFWIWVVHIAALFISATEQDFALVCLRLEKMELNL